MPSNTIFLKSVTLSFAPLPVNIFLDLKNKKDMKRTTMKIKTLLQKIKMFYYS